MLVCFGYLRLSTFHPQLSTSIYVTIYGNLRQSTSMSIYLRHYLRQSTSIYVNLRLSTRIYVYGYSVYVYGRSHPRVMLLGLVFQTNANEDGRG